MTLRQELLDLIRAWCRYRGTRVCTAALDYVARRNQEFLTSRDAARTIERLKETLRLRVELARQQELVRHCAGHADHTGPWKEPS